MGLGSLFSSDSTSKASETNIGGADQAKIISGKKNVLLESGSVSLGGKDSKIITGGVDVSGAKAGGDLKAVGGSDFAGNVGTITISSTAGLTETALGSLLDKVTVANAEQIAAFKEVATQQSEQIGTLAENKQTEGEAGRDKTVTVIVFAVLALAGLLIWKIIK